MKLATIRNGTPDGQLVVVSRDLSRAADASDLALTLQDALDEWEVTRPLLQRRFEQLEQRSIADFHLNPFGCTAPLPRAYQWCDASAFLHHGRLMERAFKHPPRENFETIPLMYQGGSDDFLGPHDDVLLPSEQDGIDFEGEFIVITSRVPMGVRSQDALRHVALIGQANDWSLRSLIPREINSGFGFFQSKPSTSFAPVVVTPDELGPAWRDGRVALDLHVEWNGRWFGHPNGAEMHFGFADLIAHAARTRKLGAGTIIGSGTVSNVRPDVGSACISEKRVIEVIDQGAPSTGFMRFGDRVRMSARDPSGVTPFGVIDQKVVSLREQQMSPGSTPERANR
ncbi:MAG TPA: fumarylacetoacetate hydrolase family protein [Ramlibacter sp.]|nr:fumarylacetoacetate hydrolase family protein [Ramlibacter sp.]